MRACSRACEFMHVCECMCVSACMHACACVHTRVYSCTEESTATLFNNATSYIAKSQLTGEQASSKQLRFYFRVWEAKEEVRVFTQSGGANGGSPLLVLSVDDTDIVVRALSLGAVATHRVAFPDVKRVFEYIHVLMTYTPSSLPQSTGEQQTSPSGGTVNITIGYGAARKSVVVTMDSFATDAVTFGTRTEYAADPPSKGFQGHLRGVRYNGRNVFPQHIRGNAQVCCVSVCLASFHFTIGTG